MKKIKNIFKYAAFILALGTAASCSRDEAGEVKPVTGSTEVTIETRAIPSGDQCTLYVFKKGVSDPQYKLDKTVNITAPTGKATVSFDDSDLQSCGYRFFYLSQPGSISNGVSVKNASNSTLTTGDLWSSVRVIAGTQEISGDIYYLVEDIAGNKIKTDGSVSSTLVRLVGRQVINIYKKGAGGLDDPEPTSTDVKSVLDRVISMQFKYTGLTKTIGFNASGAPYSFNIWSPYSPAVRNLSLIQVAGSDYLKAPLPMSSIDIEEISGVGGSARILGIWGLPAQSAVRVNVEFTYYHTLPSECQDATPSTHQHTKDCYAVKPLSLDIPGSAALLSIIPNSYTVTRAGLNYDRIIDVGFSGGFGFETEWANGDI